MCLKNRIDVIFGRCAKKMFVDSAFAAAVRGKHQQSLLRGKRVPPSARKIRNPFKVARADRRRDAKPRQRHGKR